MIKARYFTFGKTTIGSLALDCLVFFIVFTGLVNMLLFRRLGAEVIALENSSNNYFTSIFQGRFLKFHNVHVPPLWKRPCSQAMQHFYNDPMLVE